jgi:hypothetical protein
MISEMIFLCVLRVYDGQHDSDSVPCCPQGWLRLSQAGKGCWSQVEFSLETVGSTKPGSTVQVQQVDTPATRSALAERVVGCTLQSKTPSQDVQR